MRNSACFANVFYCWIVEWLRSTSANVAGPKHGDATWFLLHTDKRHLLGDLDA
jgi:hypothetical protein